MMLTARDAIERAYSRFWMDDDDRTWGVGSSWALLVVLALTILVFGGQLVRMWIFS
jgi:hypothetical protein